VTLGVVRFRVLDYIDEGEPYLVGEVEFFEDDEADTVETDGPADEVFELFQRIAKAAFKMSGGRGKLPEIHRGDPEQLSFLVTAAFNFENELKYRLLEMTSTSERLEKLREILKKMVGQMEESADIHAVSKTNGHSKKKLDL
ncbi:MAG: LON peptidase substrate-binding domain-containing protein, partial [Pyrinomonadaceae bacterium]